jgi:hypothetical protein
VDRQRIGAKTNLRAFVQMHIEPGKPIGGKVALNGDDAARIAARLTREALAKQMKKRSFSRPLVYAPRGIV